MKVIKKIFSGLHLIIDLLILIAIIFCIYAGNYIYKQGYILELKEAYAQAKDVVDNASSEDFTHSETGTSYYDSDGSIILMSYGGRYLEYDEIPSAAVDAIISIEDSRFFTHKGIDLKGIARAFYHLYESRGKISQGGSTITQQLLKLKYIGSERTYDRKITEAFCALLFERKFTKEDIMEYYMNTIYFANQYYGIDAAAYGYFGTDTTQLSTAQLAFILAIPNSPTNYNPYENFDGTKVRQKRILNAMFNEGYITESELSDFIDEPIIIVEKGSQDTLVDNTGNYPFSYINREAIKAVMQVDNFKFQYYFDSEKEESAYYLDYEKAYAQAKQELASGYVVNTSIAKQTQDSLQESIDGFMDTIDVDKTEDDVYVYQSSATCIDNETGLITAIVGGRTDGSYLNRAYQSFRQPGSTIKPLVVYTPAIELKEYTADTIVNDHDLGEDGCKNANLRYAGDMTLRTAVSNSINTIAWQLFDEITPSVGLQYIKNMNFSKIVDDDYQIAAGIGGLTKGTSSLEMASGYATIYNDGIYRQASCIESIYDSTGKCIYLYEDYCDSKRIYESDSSNKMIDILTSVFSGTAKGLSVDGFCAAKTGTTNDSKDSWFCGITEKYSTAVWVGRDDGVSMGSGVSGAGYAGTIWHDFMLKANK